jgi:hypothetical protein
MAALELALGYRFCRLGYGVVVWATAKREGEGANAGQNAREGCRVEKRVKRRGGQNAPRAQPSKTPGEAAPVARQRGGEATNDGNAP